MKVCFVIGAEDLPKYPCDTPEAYWRVFLPARVFGSAAVLGRHGASEKALASDVVWIYEPTCFAAAALAEVARQMGKPVVVDWSEDIYTRHEQDRPYLEARIEAAEKAMGAATAIVCCSRALCATYAGQGRVAAVETVLPPSGWEPGRPDNIIAWWSDGRQKRGFEAVAPALIEVLEATNADMVNVQFAHELPLMKGVDTEDEQKKRAKRMYAYFSPAPTLGLEEQLGWYRSVFAQAAVSIDCYLPGSYRESVSDVPLLRAAALGIPTVTTRSFAPPGCVSAPAAEWADALLTIMRNPTKRAALSASALLWAQQRSTYEGYQSFLSQL